MYFKYVCLIVFFTYISCTNSDPVTDEIIQIHVVFRHGQKIPQKNYFYPRDPNNKVDFYPFDYGALSNTGKSTEYKLGSTLREKYNDLLGEYYVPENLRARATNVTRTIMSLELVLASLYKPVKRQRWNDDLDWQPIPFNVFPLNKELSLSAEVACKNYKSLYAKSEDSLEQKEIYKKYKKEFQYISNHTGEPFRSFEDAHKYYGAFLSKQEVGLEIPKWANEVFPDVLKEMASHFYESMAATPQMKRILAGYFLEELGKHFLNKVIDATDHSGIYLYAAHQENIATTLIALDLFNPPVVPTFGSFLIFELHKVNEEYAVKILFQNYETEQPKTLKLKDCEELCPLNKFITYVEKVKPLPNDCVLG